MPSTSIADWQLPPGVSRGLWDYLHDTQIAQDYDVSLARNLLPEIDEQFATRWLTPPGRTIDLGCATGRLMITLARRGHSMLGVDLSAEMLRIAKEKGHILGLKFDCLQANLVELDCLNDASFDHAACLFSTLGMITGAEPRRRVIRHVYRLLRPGGRFVLHVHNRWFNVWDPAGCLWLLQDLFRQLWSDPRAGDRSMPTHQGIAGLALHHFTHREVVRLLRREGFRMCKVQPISLPGRLATPFALDHLRTYGYLIASEKRKNPTGLPPVGLPVFQGCHSAKRSR